MSNFPNNRYKAILFDLDGVLIDSIEQHIAAWQEVFQDYGVELPGLELRLSEGEKAELTARRLALKYGLDLSDKQLEELVEKKRNYYKRIATRGLRDIAGKVVAECRKKGYITGIVTGSVRSNLEWTLSKAERDLFYEIITPPLDYNKGKPAPEPYLKAADKLGLEPRECLAIENAPLGIQSAKAAGMTCVAITTTLPRTELQGADYILSDLDGLWEMLDLLP